VRERVAANPGGLRHAAPKHSAASDMDIARVVGERASKAGSLLGRLMAWLNILAASHYDVAHLAS
jgi:hypothetical protein